MQNRFTSHPIMYKCEPPAHEYLRRCQAQQYKKITITI